MYVHQIRDFKSTNIRIQPTKKAAPMINTNIKVAGSGSSDSVRAKIVVPFAAEANA
jgi:hypothetical protein